MCVYEMGNLRIVDLSKILDLSWRCEVLACSTPTWI